MVLLRKPGVFVIEGYHRRITLNWVFYKVEMKSFEETFARHTLINTSICKMVKADTLLLNPKFSLHSSLMLKFSYIELFQRPDQKGFSSQTLL